MEKNKEMIQKLKDVKSIMVSRELRGDDWDECRRPSQSWRKLFLILMTAAEKESNFRELPRQFLFLILFS